MKASRHTVNVSILGKDYQVGCQPEEEGQLAESARHLDQNMRKIRGTGKVVGADRIAVMAALNVTHAMLHGTEEERQESRANETRLRELAAKIDRALDRLA